MPADVNQTPCRTADGLVSLTRNPDGIFDPCNRCACFKAECAFIQMTYLRLMLNQQRKPATLPI